MDTNRTGVATDHGFLRAVPALLALLCPAMLTPLA